MAQPLTNDSRLIGDRTKTSRFVRSAAASVVAVGIAAGLLYWAFRNAPIVEIAQAVRRIGLGQLASLFLVNSLFIAVTAVRWRLIAKSDIGGVSFVDLMKVRLAAFGLSYFTPGPQVGGEPLQVLYLRRRYATTLARATATVVMDRLLELLANFVFLVLGSSLLLRHGTAVGLHAVPPWILLMVLPITAWPLIHVYLLWSGRHPFSGALRWMMPGWLASRLIRFISASEHLAGRYCRRNPAALISGIGLSLGACILAVLEYGLVTSFLHLGLDIWQVLGAWSAGWISFLVPLPGGVGALEASQVLALGAFGVAPATALGVTLILRARDLLFGGLGLLLSVTYVRPFTNPYGAGRNRASR